MIINGTQLNSAFSVFNQKSSQNNNVSFGISTRRLAKDMKNKGLSILIEPQESGFLARLLKNGKRIIMNTTTVKHSKAAKGYFIDTSIPKEVAVVVNSPEEATKVIADFIPDNASLSVILDKRGKNKKYIGLA